MPDQVRALDKRWAGEVAALERRLAEEIEGKASAVTSVPPCSYRGTSLIRNTPL